MAEEAVSVIELQLDASEAIANATELGDVLNGLKKVSSSIGAVASKMFAHLLNSLKNVHSEVDAVSTSLAKLATTPGEVKISPETSQPAGSLFDGITAGYDAMKELVGELESIEKYSPKFQELFKNVTSSTNMGELVNKVLPKTDGLFDTVSSWINDDVLAKITETLGRSGGVFGDGLSGVITSITGAFSGIGSALSGMSLGWGAAIAGIIALIVLLVTNWDTVQAAIVTAWEAIQSALATAAEWLNTTVVQPVVGFFTDAWNGIVSIFTGVGMWFQENVIQPIIDVFSPIVEWFAALFSSIWQTVSDVFHNIGVIISGCWETLQAVWGAVADWFYNMVIQPVVNFFTGLWDGVVNAATQAWDGIVAVFSAVTGFFGDIFSKAWAAVVGVFSAAGDIFNNIKDGILSVFKTIVNGLITGINAVVAVPFNGINGAIDIIRNIRIFDIQPFGGLESISVPQIPYLAKGAVLPANRPFLAVVGDQRHGTNVEAPLTTIQEAVALVMEDYATSNMAGHEATVAVLRDILEAVLGIRIGDDVIGQAADRYRRKMAVVRGGW